MVDYHEKAQQAIANNPELTWAKIKDHTSEIMYRLTQQKVRYAPSHSRCNLTYDADFLCLHLNSSRARKTARRRTWRSSTSSTRTSLRPLGHFKIRRGMGPEHRVLWQLYMHDYDSHAHILSILRPRPRFVCVQQCKLHCNE